MSEELEKNKELYNEKKMKLSQELEASSGSIEKRLSEFERLIKDKTNLMKNQELAKLGQQKILQGLQQDSEKIKSRLAAERKAAESRTKGDVLNPSLTVLQIVAKIKRIQEQKKKNPTEVARRRREEIGEVYRGKQILLGVQKSKLEAQKKMFADMEEANWKRRDHFHIIRKWVCKSVIRQFNHDSGRFSHEVRFYPVFAMFNFDPTQYGHRVYMDIDNTTRELNFVFRNQGKASQAKNNQGLNIHLFRWGQGAGGR